MDSTEALQALIAFDNTLASEINGKQGIREALAVALKLLNEGYHTDQLRIDAVTEEKDAIITDLQAKVETLTAPTE